MAAATINQQIETFFAEYEARFDRYLSGDTPKIFAYITGDEERVLQEHGLTP